MAPKVSAQMPVQISVPALSQKVDVGRTKGGGETVGIRPAIVRGVGIHEGVRLLAAGEQALHKIGVTRIEVDQMEALGSGNRSPRKKLVPYQAGDGVDLWAIGENGPALGVAVKTKQRMGVGVRRPSEEEHRI
jgi:hypothetical protein